jgi:predicted hotdog family 3-hydroxylacyl-ACP dehydratase
MSASRTSPYGSDITVLPHRHRLILLAHVQRTLDCWIQDILDHSPATHTPADAIIRSDQWNHQLEGAAPLILAVELNPSSEQVRELLAQMQTQTGSLRAPCRSRLHAREGFK